MKRLLLLLTVFAFPLTSNAATYSGTATGAELDYVHGVTSAIQTQLDARALESILGTSIGTGLLLDGTVLKASSTLQTWHGITPGIGVATAAAAAVNGSGGFLTYGDTAGTAAVLTGYTSGAGTVSGTDTILQAIQKLNGNLADAFGAGADGERGMKGTSNTIDYSLEEAGTFAYTEKAGVPKFYSGTTERTLLYSGGTIQGRAVFNSYTEAQTLTAATHNGSVVRMTTADEVTMWDCETANVGDFVTLWARDAEKIEVVPATDDQFYLFDGTGIGANDELDMAATAGTKVTLMCTADDSWSVYSETAACADGGAAD